MIRPVKFVRLLNGRHIVWVFDYANERPVARLFRAVVTRISVRNVVADRTVCDLLFDDTNAIDQRFDVITRFSENMKGKALRALCTISWEPLELLDLRSELAELFHPVNPGIFSPPIMPPILPETSSSTFR